MFSFHPFVVCSVLLGDILIMDLYLQFLSIRIDFPQNYGTHNSKGIIIRGLTAITIAKFTFRCTYNSITSVFQS